MPDLAFLPDREFSAQPSYSISERHFIVSNLRKLTAEIARSNGRRVSSQRLAGIIDDVFNEFPGWMTIRNPFFVSVHGDRIDPKTLRNLLTCEMRLNLMDIKVGSIRLIDVFLQIVAASPPKWL